MAKGKDPLAKQVVKALKAKREDLQQQLLDIAEALALYDPPAPLLQRTAMEQHMDKILVTMQPGRWYTKRELAKATGINSRISTRAAEQLVAGNKLDTKIVHSVAHYQLKPQKMKIVAGEGELKQKPRRRSTKKPIPMNQESSEANLDSLESRARQ